MPRLYRSILRTALALGLFLLLLALIPGDFSVLGLLKSLADRTVADGDFEALTVDFYNRLRFLFGVGAFLFLTAGMGIWIFHKKPRLALGFSVGGLLVVGMGIFGLASLAALRLNSPVYRYLSGTPLAYKPPPATPIPTPTPIPSPTPTLAVSEPGRWELIASGIDAPVAVTAPDDGSERLFVGAKTGVIWIIQNGQTLPTPFLDIRDRVLQELESPEQGFLGLTFHPNYAQNRYFYVNYTDPLGDTAIARYQVSGHDPNQADTASETLILRVVQPEAIHNGGHLAFGPDGYLYVSTGDGGIRLDPGEYAQALDLLLGKILRLDVDHGDPYAIPSDNPFAGRGAGAEIWLYGLRNPWRFSFDSLTGDLYMGDVGHDDWEEINFVPAGSPGGLNFGWNHYEGSELYTQYATPPPSPLADHTPPVWEYRNHTQGTCAVVGGYVYRGEVLPDLWGTYLYGDYCAGIIWGLRQNAQGEWENTALFDTDFFISSFGVDAHQNLYLTDIRGSVYQLLPK